MDIKLLKKIKKGVEHCRSGSPICEYCPYNKKPTSTTYDCYSVLRSNILYLINDLEMDIENRNEAHLEMDIENRNEAHLEMDKGAQNE